MVSALIQARQATIISFIFVHGRQLPFVASFLTVTHVYIYFSVYLSAYISNWLFIYKIIFFIRNDISVRLKQSLCNRGNPVWKYYTAILMVVNGPYIMSNFSCLLSLYYARPQRRDNKMHTLILRLMRWVLPLIPHFLHPLLFSFSFFFLFYCFIAWFVGENK